MFAKLVKISALAITISLASFSANAEYMTKYEGRWICQNGKDAEFFGGAWYCEDDVNPINKKYGTYPRKCGKAMARAKWNQITGNGMQAKCRDRDGNVMDVDLYARPEDLIEGAKAYRYECVDAETPQHFIAHPSTWLNQGRWDDLSADERADKARKMDAILERTGGKPSLRMVKW